MKENQEALDKLTRGMNNAPGIAWDKSNMFIDNANTGKAPLVTYTTSIADTKSYSANSLGM